VGRYYERVSANRFAKIQREKRLALEPELSPSEAYKELLRRIAVLAWEEMDQPLEDINHKVVVRLVRVLLAARREKHMATRVWVERRKAENWMAREVLRHWRRENKRRLHVSYLPMLVEPSGAWNQYGETEKETRGTETRREAGALNPTREGACAPRKAAGDSTLKRHECAPGGDACDTRMRGREKSGAQQNPPNHFALDRCRPIMGTLGGKLAPTKY